MHFILYRGLYSTQEKISEYRFMDIPTYNPQDETIILQNTPSKNVIVDYISDLKEYSLSNCNISNNTIERLSELLNKPKEKSNV